MNILALDVGTVRTGVAFGNSKDDILFSLTTISHTSEDELLNAVQEIIAQKQIEEVVVGLPLLPSGEEGAQVLIARSLYNKLVDSGISTHLLDERYTSPKNQDLDSDAAAACEILSVWLKKKQ